jgi:thiol:disulfide interchange protein DsbD
MPRTLPSILAVAAAVAAVAAAAAPVKTEHVEAELVSERTALVPGQATTVALRLKMADGWHTYWQNPGDSGLPTTLAWTLPAGVTAGPIQWPAPHTLPVGPLLNYGYEGEVLCSPTSTCRPSRQAGDARAQAKAEWLVCRETCIPGGHARPRVARGRARRPLSAMGQGDCRHPRRVAARAARLARRRPG